MFRRRRGRRDDDAFDDESWDDEAPDPTGDDVGDDGSDDDEPGAAAASSGPAPAAAAGGPWDVADVPDDGLPRVDLGALLVPVPDGIEVRVDVQDNVVVAVTLVDGNSAMQVHAFAAPRSSGIWTEVRDEIAESVRAGGGSAEPADGPFGPELRARVASEPAEGAAPGASAPTQPLRFIGVDGPRWFLRGLVNGPAATDPNQAGRLLEVFRGIVVVRGGEAMAPRDMLPLRLPKEAMQHAPAEEQARRPGLEMLERGPEITETR